MKRANVVSSTDVALLRALAHERSLVGASRRLGISRDQAVYRVGRMTRAFGGPVVQGVRGGSTHGGTVLTALGDRIVRGGFDSVEMLDARPVTAFARPNLLRGLYRAGPAPEVRVGRGLRLRVAFPAVDRSPVSLLLDPEAIVVARERFASSARNVLSGTVERVLRGPGRLDATLVVRCAGTRLRVAVTDEPIHELGLRRGVTVTLYVKATALRRVGRIPRASRGPRPS